MNDVGFGSWLRARHARMATPADLIEAFVKKATGGSVESSGRIIRGQMNEVYDITTGSGQQVIVRVSHADDSRFEAERWALDAARQHGVPTPEVLLADRTRHGNAVIAVCVEEKPPGVPLDQLLNRAPAHRHGIDTAQIGQVLAGIHAVHIAGFGYLQPDGKGWPVSFAEVMFAAAHILVSDGNVTGVIDFQDCSGNHPVFDFVQWHVTSRFLRYPIMLRSLMRAYPNSDLFDEAFEPIFNLALLRYCLWMLMVYAEDENPRGAEGLEQELDRALRCGAL